MILLAIAAALTAPAPAIRGERLPDLIAHESQTPENSSEPVDKNDPPVCTADRKYCFNFQQNIEIGYDLLLTDPAGTRPPATIATIPVNSSEETISLWPQLLRVPRHDPPQMEGALADELFVGVQTRTSTMYSGGGGSATELRLFRAISTDGSTIVSHEVLAMPIAASKMIRACFSERDLKDRRGACHDEYRFDATLSPIEGGMDGDPAFALSVKATRFPGPVTLNEDSRDRGRLKKADLVAVSDAQCTYDRVLRYNPATGRYEFDRPGPDCSEFTVP